MTAPAVLLVDENPIVRRLVRISLLTQGYDVREAGGAHSALASASDAPPDLVLMSLVQPDMDGCELAEELRRLPGARGLRIVALANHAAELDDLRLIATRFDDFLFKPVEPSNVVRTVQGLLASGERGAAAAGAGRRVLVVDDDPMQLRLLKLSLSQLGGEVVTARGAEAALTALAGSEFDAVVSDVLMPGMDGYALCLEIRRNAAHARLPIVLVSASYLDDHDRKLAIDVGAAVLVNRSDGTRAIADALTHALTVGGQPASVADDFGEAHARRTAQQLKNHAARYADLAAQSSVQSATLAVVGAVSEVLSRQLDVDAGLGSALRSCLDAAGLAQGAIYVASAGELTPRCAVGLDSKVASQVWEDFLGHHELFERAMRTRRPLALPSTEIPDDLTHSVLARLGGMTSAALHPMVCIQGCLGVLVLAARRVDLASPHWLGFGQAVSSQLAQGITLGRSFRRVSDSESRYRALMDQANDAVLVADLEGRIVEVNRRCEDVSGLGRAAILGHHFLDFVQPGEATRLSGDMLRLMEAGATHCFGVELRRPDGRRMLVDISASRVDLPEAPCIMASLRDVTARVEAEEALARARQDFRQIIELAPDAVAIRRGEHLLFVNPAMANALEYQSPAELCGKRLLDIVAPDDHAVVRSRLDATDGRPSTIHLLTRSGEATTWEFSPSQPIQFEGAPAALFIARDLTERTKLQTQLMVSDRLASVGTLAAGVAHEMNNPLASVLANLDLAIAEVRELRRTVSGLDDVADELKDARESADRVRNVVRDLKLFSRGEEETSGPCDVRRVMESSLRMAWNEIRHRARLCKDYGRTVAAEANESRLGQVFLNLIVNAAQAIPEGQAEQNEIRVRTEMDGAEIMIEIADSGPGIPPEVQRRLFTPFFTTKPVGVGTGLGLSICQRIVTGMGGRIELGNRPGGLGAIARVWLPAARLEAGRRPDHPSGLIAAAAPARRGRVLLIDDEPLIASVVRRALTRSHDVTALTSAADALARLRAGEQYDVILCDLMMPHMTGMDLYEELSAFAPEEAARVIFLTGGAFTPRARAFLDAVSNHRLDKPFDNQSLRVLVDERVR